MTDHPLSPSVRPGTCITVKLLSRNGDFERLEFDLVPDENADYQNGFLGVSTPIAKAILGEKSGVTVPYFTDELLAIEILSIRESTRIPDPDAAVRRDAAVKNAKDQIDFTNAVLFAASVDTKWGSYDADSLDYETWIEKQSKGTDNSDEE